MINEVVAVGTSHRKKLYASEFSAGTIFMSVDASEKQYWMVTSDNTLISLSTGFLTSKVGAWTYGEVVRHPAEITIKVGQ